MAIVVSQVTHNSAADEGDFYLWAIKEFLVSVGWTVAGSGDGNASGGMDAVDRITVHTVFSDPQAWVVVQSPHASAADRIQIMLDKGGSSTDATGRISYNPAADYAGGGGATYPTSSFEAIIFFSTVTTGPMRMVFIGDNISPYGFACKCHPIGDLATDLGGMAVIPLDLQIEALPGKPYVVYVANGSAGFNQSSLNNITASLTSSRGLAEPKNPSQVPVSVGAMAYVHSEGTVIPNNLQLSDSAQDYGFPILYAGTTSGLAEVFGFTTFMQWTGTNRNSFDLYTGLTRIVFDDVSFPWDGATSIVP